LQDQSEGCIGKTLKEVRISGAIKRNCRVGSFVALNGSILTFVGPNLDRDGVGYGPEYLMLRQSEKSYLDGSSASGYPFYFTLSNLRLCAGCA